MFSTKPLNSLADLEGLKVAGAGYNLRYLEGIPGAAGVRGGLPDFYNMLQTGVVEAAMTWPEAAATFKFAVNADVWAGLPDELKEVLQAVAIEYRDHVAGIAMDRAEASRQAFIEAGGTIVVMSQEERQAWANSMPNIAAEWAANLDSTGAPGSEMLQAYMGKLAAAGFTPLRDWAAE